jgi:hypothetical protein
MGFMLQPFYPGEAVADTNWIGAWLGPQSPYVRFGKEENLLPLPGIDPWFLSQACALLTIPIVLSWLILTEQKLPRTKLNLQRTAVSTICMAWIWDTVCIRFTSSPYTIVKQKFSISRLFNWTNVWGKGDAFCRYVIRRLNILVVFLNVGGKMC